MATEPTDRSEEGSSLGAEKKRWRASAASIPDTTADESAAITTAVRDVLTAHDWTAVLTFLAMPGEVDLGALRDDPGLRLAVTRTPSRGPLTIHALEEPLERHPFGYLQPAAGATPVSAEAIEVVLVPGLLFARDGGRLGHGKGYYDTLLRSFAHRPFLLGVTVDRRVVPRLPMAPHDVSMDGLATETGFHDVAARPG